MEDFNIAKALKFAPKGLPLYSPIFGEVNLSEVSGDSYPIEVKWIDKSYKFTEHGRYFDGKGECLLFPSKDHRTWDNWQSVLFPQSIGCVCAYTGTIPQPTMFLCTSNRTVFSDNTGNTWDVLIGHSGNYLKSSRYATPEESKQFFDELKANGYEWEGKNVVKTTPTSPFKVGDWVVNKLGEVWHIDSVDKINYQVSNEKGCYNYFPISEQDEMRHWTIQDVKDGDVLARNNDVKSICIFAHFDGINKEEESFLCYCGLEGEGLVQELSINGYHDDSNGYIPATKEQRDILFTKLREVGYEWVSGIKLLKKIVTYEELNNAKSDKFDVSSLKPFDKVLVRDKSNAKWYSDFYSFYDNDLETDYKFVTTAGNHWMYCIPYNDDTKHLIGTTDDAPEFYKTWEYDK